VLGVPVRELAACANTHSCRFDLLATDAREAADLFLRYLCETGGYDVLRLPDVPEGGKAFALYEAAMSAGLAVGTWESLRSPYLPLPSRFDELLGGLQAKFKSNLRRRRRKLEERGEVCFERYAGGLELDAKLEEGLFLEQSGWKGERGTAIAQDGRTRGFYAELARHASAQGQLALCFLRLNGRAVAFQYGLHDGRRYLFLKPGFDESLKECSPGQLLVEEVLKDCIGQKLTEFDFLGPDMTWKQDWTQRKRVHTWLYVFADTAFARALSAAKFRWWPAAKGMVARWNR
jgi:CelD/BcsL family acetyltransferase involved in cellulose biosynthesis